MLKKDHRLCNNNEILSVLKKGERHYDSGVLLYWKETSRTTNRFAFIVGKKFSPLAIKRNQQKRILRHAIMDLIPQIKSGHDIVITYANRDKMLPYMEAKRILLSIFDKNNLLIQKQ